jgi:hypothetical protein
MMTQKTLFEQMDGTYSQFGEVLLPDLTVENSKPIGKYGRMRKRYLQEHRPILFSELILSGNLYQNLAETDHACKERIELIIRQMKEQEDISETLKTADQMEWVRRLNGIQKRAEEIVLSELVYS